MGALNRPWWNRASRRARRVPADRRGARLTRREAGAYQAVGVLVLAMLLGGSASTLAQGPTYGVGRTPTPEELTAWDISIGPAGEELPPGSGTAGEGERIYRIRCAGCHGRELEGGRAPRRAPRLVKSEPGSDVDPWAAGRILPYRSPYATTVWDYINRGMPLYQEGSLTADQVYALTAFLLYRNEVIAEDLVLDAESLPKVEMPNRDGWAPLPDWQPRSRRLPGYPF